MRARPRFAGPEAGKTGVMLDIALRASPGAAVRPRDTCLHGKAGAETPKAQDAIGGAIAHALLPFLGQKRPFLRGRGWRKVSAQHVRVMTADSLP